MSYFNLRKRAPEPDEVDEEVDQTEDEPEDEAPTPANEQPTSWTGAIWCGMCGPWRWLAGHFGDYGVTIAWTVHVGSPWAFFYYRGWAAVGIALGWPLAFLLFIPREYLDRLTAAVEQHSTEANRAPEPGEPEAEEQPPADPETVYAATLEWICGQIADRNGIHLTDLLNHAHTHGLHTDLDVTAFRAVLEGWGFPIRQQLKVGGRNRPGIHRDDLSVQPLPPLSPEEGAASATSVEYLA